MIDKITVTIPSNATAYIFQIEISTLELDRLKHETFLGIEFKKEKYRFLCDLSDVLAWEILKTLERVGNDR